MTAHYDVAEKRHVRRSRDDRGRSFGPSYIKIDGDVFVRLVALRTLDDALPLLALSTSDASDHEQMKNPDSREAFSKSYIGTTEYATTRFYVYIGGKAMRPKPANTPSL